MSSLDIPVVLCTAVIIAAYLVLSAQMLRAVSPSKRVDVRAAVGGAVGFAAGLGGALLFI